MQSFQEFDLLTTTHSALARMGYTQPTPIQAQAIPHILRGRDVIAQARTGTGKTAAFGIPLVDGAAGDGSAGVLGLVLVPTRELAVQVADEIGRIGAGAAVRVIAVYGGVGFGPQIQALRARAPTILVATPGRLLDHLRRGTVRLGDVRMLVLDEADRMLDMGFLPDVERILKAVPKERLTTLFSATVPEPIRRLAQRFLVEPVVLRTEEGPAVTPTADQFRVDVPGDRKVPALLELLQRETPERAIVFTRTKHRARSLARTIERAGWAVVALQGNMSQSQRERALAAFRQGRAKILVATDVASRGLDVPEVGHVINFDLPDEPDAYVHRVGRTARMNRTGRAFTFVAPDQRRDAGQLERAAGVRFAAYAMGAPSGAEPVTSIPRPAPPAASNPRRRFPPGMEGPVAVQH